MPPDPPAVLAEHLTRLHHDGRRELHALDDVSLVVYPGEVVAVTGPSGSGKTTLLHLVGGLDQPDRGRVEVAGVDWQSLHGADRARFRRRTCGFVLQGSALLPQATAAENVEIALLVERVQPATRRERVVSALQSVGLDGLGGKLPDQLSGGEQQRVGIARALVNDPPLVLADEPTGSLDSATAADIVGLILAAARERRAAVIVVTHDPTVADRADRMLVLHSGRLRDDGMVG
ncbi:MAG TPA: ABC transporter ATP-binding protein [Jatrophihabitantaceae bacterium]|jgi:putative ABC transport system ATP-binding protein